MTNDPERTRYVTHDRGLCIVNRDKKLCYVNIPKCGSNSLKEVTLRSGNGWGWGNFYDDDLRDFHSFTVVREPIARFVSGCLEIKKRNAWVVGSIRDIVMALPYRVDGHIEHQWWFIEDHPLHEIVRLEDLNVETLSRLVGDEVNRVPRTNVNTQAHRDAVRADIDDDLLARLRHFYLVDFAVWREPKRFIVPN
jgi:hypothetical protein